ncbi:DUF5131 family protein [Holophaga foetida]|uniref:DUF5131 family protein n=1 Tax=Holophaga foetida TaxID=35839 RepID=UPI0002471807|nr:DUF5131 family protein [Holophaga foetida]
MHDIWNPWHGCHRVSEGCAHCYMYFLDERRGRDCSQIHRNRSGFRYPLQRDREGRYKIRSGEQIRVCMSSDFFLEEADPWREEAWDIMRVRRDVKFFLLTKRPERILAVLPADWGEGWDHVALNVSCENQTRAEERIPVLLDLPARHKGVMAAPLLGEVRLAPFLASGQIGQVIAGGENYGGARPCDFDWILRMRVDCERFQVSFCFIETGSYFLKDGRAYRMPRRLQSEMAWKSGMSFAGRPRGFRLVDSWGGELAESDLHIPAFKTRCDRCGSKPICNGCSNCGKC